MPEERPEIKKLRDEFIAGLPKVNINSIRFLKPKRVRSIMLYLTSTKKTKSTIHQSFKSTEQLSKINKSPTKDLM